MRRAAAAVCCLLVSALVLASAQATAPLTDDTTNPTVPVNVLSGNQAVCRTSLLPTASTFISYANNNVCFQPGQPTRQPSYYISNACSLSSAIVPYPADGFFPGTQTPIPQNQWVCDLPGSTRADGSIAAAAFTSGTAVRCVSTDRGVCPSSPSGPAAANVDRTNSWARPRTTSFAVTQYLRVSVGQFLNFPLEGADGTYVFPTTIPGLQAFTTTSTSFGTAQFDAKCRSAGPANSRAIICADGTNQNYFSAPLQYGFSPSSRSAFTFMTYGRGATQALERGLENSFTNGGMQVSNPAVYAKYVTFAALGNTVLPRAPQKVQQPIKPVYAFDPLNVPVPAFVPIGQSVDQLIKQGVDRLALINAKRARFQAANPSVTYTNAVRDNLEARTFNGFYKGEQIGEDPFAADVTVGTGASAIVYPPYFGGLAGSDDQTTAAGVTEQEVLVGYARQPTWSGCFGPGPQVNGVITSYRVGTSLTLQSAGGAPFFDVRFNNGQTNSQGAARSSLPSAPGLSADISFTCNDWTTTLDTTTNTAGIVGDPGAGAGYTAGNTAGSAPNQAYVNTWLSDNLKPLACNTPNNNVYCSWHPTNVDGVQNGDETGVDCGGTTLGADNQGRPTPSCSCRPGQFYDYQFALCIPCIQDTYCNLATGCLRECYPCFTAPTSGAVLGDTNKALFPNKFANPQVNNLNSVDQTAGVGTVRGQAVAPRSTPFGASFNTNGQNVILVGTTFNQATQRYQFEATQCFCNVGFAVGTSTATTPGTPLNATGSGNLPLYTELRGWSGANGFKPRVTSVTGITSLGPFDGSNCVPVVRGDPQITGLQGQDFQVHGIPDEIFNMVSHPDLQVNSRFVYLEEAKCDNYTTCFSHAGTYIDQIGMNIAGQKVKVTVGSLEEGLRVWVEGVELTVGSKRQLKSARVFFAHQRKVHIRTPLFSFAFVGTDKFMNQEVALLDGKLAKLGAKQVTLQAGEARPHQEIPIHGIVGQTWQNVLYSDGMLIEGAVADYRIEESDLFGNSFVYNQFKEQ